MSQSVCEINKNFYRILRNGCVNCLLDQYPAWFMSVQVLSDKTCMAFVYNDTEEACFIIVMSLPRL